MPERSVVTRYEAKVDGYLAGVARMQTATTQFVGKAGGQVAKHKADWDKLGKAAIVGGLAIGAVVVGAAKTYMEFEAAMSRVGAAADATATQQRALGEAAIKAGQDTVFSATEAAAAEAELVRAGISVNDVLGGALRGSLDLAAAGQIDLAQSAEIAAQAMNIFHLAGKDVGHIADVLTAGANKSAAGVDDLGMALKQGGLVASQTGLSLEETVGTLSAFADNALKGSDAGTSLKTMLQRLTPQSDEAAGVMKELGFSAYDAQGNFVGMAELAKRLKTSFGGLTVEQRNLAFATVFGSDAVRGASVIMDQGESGIRRYIDAVNDQGAAQRMAARQTDNLKGDLEQLSGTLESAFIRGGQGSNEAIRSMVQGVTDLVDKFNGLSPAAQSATVQIAAAAAAILLVGGLGIKAATSVLSFKASMDAASISGGRLSMVLKGLAGVGIAAGVAGLALELGKIGPAAHVAEVGVDALAESVGQLSGGGRLTGGIADLFREDNGIFGSDEKWVSSAEAIERFSIRAQNAFGDDLSSKVRRLQDFGASGQKMADTVKSIDGALAQMVRGGNAKEAQASLDALLKGIADPKVREQVAAQFTQMQAALDETSVGAAAAGESATGLSSNLEEVYSSATNASNATKALAEDLHALNDPTLDAREAARGFEAAIDDASAAVKKNGRTLKTGTAAGRENQKALDDVAKAAISQIDALQANGASQGTLQRTMSTSRDRLIAMAEKFGMSKKQAKAYADQVLQIPATRNTTATFRTVNVQALKTAGDYLKGLHDKHVTLTVGTVRVGNTRVNAGQYADGGAAIGPGTGTSDSIDAKLSNGEHVLTASEVQKAGGQGAIYRMRAGIRAGALRFAGGGAVGFAGGGEVDWSSIMNVMGDVTSWDDVTKARANAASRSATVRSARARLAELRAELAHTKVLRERRALLSQIAAAQDRLTAATTRSAAASKAATAAAQEYTRDRRPIIDRATGAAGTSNKSTKAFLDNIDKLTKMGFKVLAIELLNQGGPEAEAIAAQAVKSAAKARALQTQLTSSAALSNREAAMKAALTGSGGADVTVAAYERTLVAQAPGVAMLQQMRYWAGQRTPVQVVLPNGQVLLDFVVGGLDDQVARGTSTPGVG